MLEALRKPSRTEVRVTDEAQALEKAGRKVALVEGDPSNMKITTTQD
jgi:2-C-methyl-D-erythritol 4-phosphate cytidylyltransferase